MNLIFLLSLFLLLGNVSAMVAYNCSDTSTYSNVNVSALPNFNYRCICNNGYAWKNQSTTVTANCYLCNSANFGSYLATSGHTGGQCACRGSPFYWERSTPYCKVNCTLVSNTTGLSLGQAKCECVVGMMFVVTTTTVSCATLNCSAIAGTTGSNTNAATGECVCNTLARPIWNISATWCQINCS